jgi:hypothetical protein
MREDNTTNTINKANRIINALFEHLEKDNCQCCKSILKGVFE